MAARSYYRVFFVLKEDAQGYSAEGRVAQGRCVIEARGGTGRVTVYVQDLKPQIPYKAVLIKRGEDVSHSAFLGGIEVGQSRRCESRFELNADDVCGLGLPIEDFDCFTIAHEDGQLRFPLTGGATTDGRWKHNLITKPSKPAHDAIAPDIIEAVQVAEAAKPEAPSNLAVSQDNAPEQAAPSESPGTAGYMPFIKLAGLPDYAANGDDDPHIAFKAILQRFNRELSELAEIAQAEPIAAPAPTEPEDLHAASLPHETIEAAASPFSEDERAWKRVTLTELSLLPINLFDYEQKAVVSAAYYKYGHLIACDAPNDSACECVLGVPGIYTPEDSKGYRSLGFYTFRGKDGQSGPGAEGYWLKEI